MADEKLVIYAACHIQSKWTPMNQIVRDTATGLYQETNPPHDEDSLRVQRAMCAKGSIRKSDLPVLAGWLCMVGVVVFAIAKGWIFGGSPA